MSAKLGFATLLVLIGGAGAWVLIWLQTTGRWNKVVAAFQGANTTAPPTTTPAPTTTPGQLSGNPTSFGTIAPTSSLLQQAVASSSSMPAFDLSNIDGPIGGDGMAVAPLTLSSWYGTTNGAVSA